MPLLLGLLLVAVFIWFAENIGTFTAAWAYPKQRHGWEPVGTCKLSSWFLLMLISYTLVATLNRPDEARARARRSGLFTSKFEIAALLAGSPYDRECGGSGEDRMGKE